jgi:hypothetical protein
MGRRGTVVWVCGTSEGAPGRAANSPRMEKNPKGNEKNNGACARCDHALPRAGLRQGHGPRDPDQRPCLQYAVLNHVHAVGWVRSMLPAHTASGRTHRCALVTSAMVATHTLAKVPKGSQGVPWYTSLLRIWPIPFSKGHQRASVCPTRRADVSVGASSFRLLVYV